MEASTNPKDKIGRTKPQLHLVPPVADLIEAKVLELGAAKYGAYNWRDEKVAATVYLDAIGRHLKAYQDGQDDDEESGHSHIGHVRACTGILLDAMEGGNLVDDRPKKGRTAEVIKRLTTVTATKPGAVGVSPGVLEKKVPSGRTLVTDLLKECLCHVGCLPAVASQIIKGTSISDGFADPDIVYISGPMRGIAEYNFPAFDKARDLLLRSARNRAVISPADIDRHDTVTAGVCENKQMTYAKRDFYSLMVLAESIRLVSGAFVLLLEGWERSVGARAEVTIAMWLGIPLCTLKGGSYLSMTSSEVKQKLSAGLIA